MQRRVVGVAVEQRRADELEELDVPGLLDEAGSRPLPEEAFLSLAQLAATQDFFDAKLRERSEPVDGLGVRQVRKRCTVELRVEHIGWLYAGVRWSHRCIRVWWLRERERERAHDHTEKRGSLP